MATVTLGNISYTWNASTTEDTVNVPNDRLWTIHHTGYDSAGAASTAVVYLQNSNAAVTTTNANAEGKAPIYPGVSMPVNNVPIVRIKATADATIVFVPSNRSASFS